MRLRIAAVLAAGLLLSGCSAFDSVSDIFGFPAGDEEPEAPPQTRAVSASTAAASAATPNAFCLAVARHDATSNDFDTATQTRMAQKSYAQCVALFVAH